MSGVFWWVLLTEKVTSPFFVSDVLCNQIDSVALASPFQFDGNSYFRRRNAKLITFFHRTNYDKFEQLKNAILNFNYYCDLF
jgi:hypothetical protein